MSEYNKFSDSLRAKYGDGGFDNLPLTDIERSRLNKFYADEEKQPFKSQHFDQPNILAHLRVNDRVDADGKKVLFVEEVQSDWHQAGRKKGYKGDSNDALKEYKSILDQYGNLPAVDMPAEVKARLDELRPMVSNLANTVPDAPFKTTWSELAMKRAIQMAAEGGYDRIAFTTGKTQAERFDLSKQIEDIEYRVKEGSDSGVLIANDKTGREVLNKAIPMSELSDFIGKDAADKLMKNKGPGYMNSTDTAYVLNNADLKMGGEGMAGFYDNILPKFLDKYAKKWEAKTGMTSINAGEKGGDAFEVVLPNGKVVSSYASKKQADSSAKSFEGAVVRPIDNGEPVHYIDITPKMRESVVTKGQPMFAIGAGGAGAATQQNQEKK